MHAARTVSRAQTDRPRQTCGRLRSCLGRPFAGGRSRGTISGHSPLMAGVGGRPLSVGRRARVANSSGACLLPPQPPKRRWRDVASTSGHAGGGRRAGAAAGKQPPGGVRDVYEMRGSQSVQQNITDEVTAGVADIMDIDRTAELLIYLFQQLFTRKKAAGSGAEQLEEEEQQQQQQQQYAPAEAAREAAGPPRGTPPAAPAGLEVATLAGGCFWCIEAMLQGVRGVVALESGYAGGSMPEPSYKQVSAGSTGHAEVVRVTYDPSRLSYSRLLQLYFSAHDPTTLDRQGSDAGSQYRSLLCCHSAEQQQEAQRMLRRLQAELVRARQQAAAGSAHRATAGRRIAGAAAVMQGSPAALLQGAGAEAGGAAAPGASGLPPPLLQRVQGWEQDVVVTELAPAGAWQYWPAEQYHRSFFTLNRGQGYCMRIIAPRLQRFREAWTGQGLLQEEEEEEEEEEGGQ